MGKALYLLPLSEHGRDRLQQVRDHLTRVETKWSELSTDDVTTCTVLNKKAMYVVDPFKGEAYKKLIAENCRVYGSGALISSLALKVPIKHTAKAFSHGGLISMAMCGLNVCFTNIRSEMRSVLIQKSLQMGADVHTHMSTEVTHLVVGETQSKKYIVACENNITTVTEKWVEDLWEISVKLLRPIVPDRSEDFKRITEANKCPVFHGATICASNVSADEKAKLARLIDDNGGNYSAQLDKNRCTHLVMGMPGGKKHKYAMQWGMTITKPNWITDSIEKGFAQSWQLNQYKVDKPSKTSSSSTTFEETSTAEPRYVVEDTCQATALHAPQDEQAELEIMLDKIKNCDITDDLFDSMIFCVTGFNKRQREQLCKIIKDRGGMIFEKVSSSVTHVLASRTDIHSNPEVTLVKRMTGPRPHVIDIYFVLDSINYGDPPIEEDYVIMDPNGTIQNSFEKRRSTERTRKGTSINQSKTSSHLNDTTPGTSVLGSGMDTVVQNVSKSASKLNIDVTNESLNMQDDTTRMDENITEADIDATMDGHEFTAQNIPAQSAGFETTNGGGSNCHDVSLGGDATVENVGGQTKIFNNLNFYLLDETPKIKKIILENGGSITKKPISDFTVSNQVVRFDYEKWKHFRTEFVTTKWLESSLTESKVLPSQKIGYEPMFMIEDIFDGESFTYSGYDKNQKDTIKEIIEKCGGSCDTYMSKHTGHLIVEKATGEKYNCALRNNIAMVTFEWFRAISLEAKGNPKTKMNSVSEDQFQPRGHKPVPKTPKEPIRNQHIKNAHLNNLDVKTPGSTDRKNFLKKLKEEIETPESERDPTMPTSEKMQRLLGKHLDEISDENMMKKQMGPYSKSEKKRKSSRKNAPKTPRPNTAGHKLFTGSSKVLANEFDDTVGDDLSIEQPVPFLDQDESDITVQDQSTAQITEIEEDEEVNEDGEVVIQKQCFYGIYIYLHRSLERNGKTKFRKDLQECLQNFHGTIVTNLDKANYCLVNKKIPSADLVKIKRDCESKGVSMVNPDWVLASTKNNRVAPLTPENTMVVPETPNGRTAVVSVVASPAVTRRRSSNNSMEDTYDETIDCSDNKNATEPFDETADQTEAPDQMESTRNQMPKPNSVPKPNLSTVRKDRSRSRKGSSTGVGDENRDPELERQFKLFNEKRKSNQDATDAETSDSDKASTPNGLTPNTIKRRRVTVGRTKESLRQQAQMKSVDIKTDRDEDIVLSNTEIDFVYEGSPLPDPNSDKSVSLLRNNGAKEQNETINLEKSTKKSPPQVKHMFAFSGLATDEKANCIKIVQDLNAEYSDNFNEKTSICIASNLIRNEKILSALSSGALIRSTKFLFDSAEKGELLDPFNYEDQLDNLVPSKKKSKDEALMVFNAIQYWKGKYGCLRHQINLNVQPFNGWNIRFITSANIIAYEHILTSGGATKADKLNWKALGENLDDLFRGITHVITLRKDEKYIKTEYLKFFADNNIDFFTEEIISAKLVSPKDPAAPEKARVSKFKEFLKNHS